VRMKHVLISHAWTSVYLMLSEDYSHYRRIQNVSVALDKEFLRANSAAVCSKELLCAEISGVITIRLIEICRSR
jgi:hypothetical protein